MIHSNFIQYKNLDTSRGLLIGLEGGAQSGKTLFSLNLFDDPNTCYVDIQGIESYILKSCNPNFTYVSLDHPNSVIYFLRNCNFNTIILDSVTFFSYHEKVFSKFFDECIRYCDEKRAIIIVILDNLGYYRAIKKQMKMFFDIYLKIINKPSLKYYKMNGLREFHKLDIEGLGISTYCPSHTSFQIIDNIVVEIDEVIKRMIELEEIKVLNKYYFKINDQLIQGYRNLFEYVTDNIVLANRIT